MSAQWDPPVRPEYEVPLATGVGAAALAAPGLDGGAAVAGRPFSVGERLLQNGWLRKGVLLAVIAVLWEAAARWTGNDLLLPGALQTGRALADGIASGELIGYVGVSLWVLLQGYLAGVAGAFLLTSLAMSTRIGRDLLETLTAMFNPLPAIALLPLALLWFGLGKGSLVFVLMHSVMWPLALNTYAGFRGVPETLRMAGRNYGLGGARLIVQILVPAALPAILSGLKIGWAFAWRTLIAAELVFGTTSGKGGLGWYIFQSRNELFTDKVFAGLAMVIVIGLLFENIVFQSVERLTVRRWGMQR
ncbi:ABC transporter permease [Massilia forsythiae]|uniref:ABC transporter permease n=1 Tax=Massilia forsythiae TaxID=2728020 RepID=A0A7Z2VZ53_9BURK|nr:ABC transporter permease [Massilia forsythiae]QJE02101.1 ABC transporter permease [Massilia forsythiae]